ncbi:MAG: hypothetical protein HUU06_12890, partial [Planctomycetaceae bacterium]|nr:hypothetical protein [Planctomycetaceae bacterium]
MGRFVAAAASFVLLAAGCASAPGEPPAEPPSASPAAPAQAAGETPSPAPGPSPVPGAFEPSGLREDFKAFKEAKEAWRAARTEDARREARARLDGRTADLLAKWSGRAIPAQERQYWGTILREGGRLDDAAAAYRSYLAVADPASPNAVNSTTALVGCLVDAGDFDGAAAELALAAGTIYADLPEDRASAETALAYGLMRAGRLEEAAALAAAEPGRP